MNFLSRDQVRAFDKHAIETLGIPSAVLMENAGRGAAQVLEALGIRGPIVICCGKGNNGGDGLVMARHLTNRGFDVRTLLFAGPEDEIDDANLAALFARADWIVDALFGTGLTGPLRVPFDRLVTLINASPARVLAVDIPSGLDCDTGTPLGAAIRAEHTVTFIAPKLGYNPAALEFTGRVHVVDIGC